MDLFYRAILNILKDKCVNNAKFGRQRWRQFHVHLDLAIQELVCQHIFWDSQANPSKNCKHNHSDTEHHPYQKLPRRHQDYTILKAKSHLLMGCQTLWDAGRAARQLFVLLLILTCSLALPTENLGFCYQDLKRKSIISHFSVNVFDLASIIPFPSHKGDFSIKMCVFSFIGT